MNLDEFEKKHGLDENGGKKPREDTPVSENSDPIIYPKTGGAVGCAPHNEAKVKPAKKTKTDNPGTDMVKAKELGFANQKDYPDIRGIPHPKQKLLPSYMHAVARRRPFHLVQAIGSDRTRMRLAHGRSPSGPLMQHRQRVDLRVAAFEELRVLLVLEGR